MKFWLSISFTFTILVSVYSSASSGAEAMIAGQNTGHVNITGSIMGTPCTIDVGEPDQTLNIGNHAVSHIIKEGRGPEHIFSIQLYGCSFNEYETQSSTNNIFRIMFDGENDFGHFRNLGSANGIAIMISDPQGNIASPGRHLPHGRLEKDMKFDYTLNLISNQDIIQPGDLHLTIRFRIDYN
ncbi:fimbrial protein [Pantoea rwandensis]|uniref:Fimbrial protein n=1 Tax=Pantoea rwandensis TaxID=1076550 RepID=A0A1X1CX40_9GAMM|nr:fimbrial protein [Pantoea rwandensis]ORM69023.1 hypothetical protein HA51_12110 [Pantoea rwandensis]